MISAIRKKGTNVAFLGSVMRLFLIAFFPISLYGQAKITRVYPYSINEKGVTYFLPKSTIEIEITLKKITFKAGDLAPYAEILLGKKALLSPSVHYDVDNVQMTSVGVPDEEQRYVVEFRPQTPSSFVSLTDKGILAGINSSWSPTEKKIKKQPVAEKPLPPPALPNEYALATSKAMRAKIVAETLFTLREDLMLFVSGKAENAPKEGEAYKHSLEILQAQVSALEALFYGQTESQIIQEHFTLYPSREQETQRLAYFSPERGIFGDGGQSTEVITFQYKPILKQEQLSLEDEEKRNKRLEGVVYNVPGRAEIALIFPSGQVYKKELPITQLGNQVLLNKNINKNKSDAVAITFNPNTGQLLEITDIK